MPEFSNLAFVCSGVAGVEGGASKPDRLNFWRKQLDEHQRNKVGRSSNDEDQGVAAGLLQDFADGERDEVCLRSSLPCRPDRRANAPHSSAETAEAISP